MVKRLFHVYLLALKIVLLKRELCPARIKPQNCCRGSSTVNLEIDGVKAEIEIVEVSNDAQKVSIMVGTTFTELPNVCVFKTQGSPKFFLDENKRFGPATGQQNTEKKKKLCYFSQEQLYHQIILSV